MKKKNLKIILQLITIIIIFFKFNFLHHFIINQKKFYYGKKCVPTYGRVYNFDII